MLYFLKRTAVVCAACCALSLGTVTPAYATAMFSYSIDFLLTINDIEVDGVSLAPPPVGFGISSEFGFDSKAFAEGNASVSITPLPLTTSLPADPQHLGVGSSLSFHVQSEGTANPPGGLAQSFYTLVGRMDLVNDSASDVTVRFGHSLAYNGSASVTDPERELAFSTVFLFLARVDDDGTAVQELVNEEEKADGDFFGNEFRSDHPDEVDGVFLDPHSKATLALLMGGVGHASVVPEPGSLLLLGTGLLAAGAQRWRRTRQSSSRDSRA